jgi:hypothetical protein
MAVNQSTPRTQGNAVRRAVRALKHIHDEQVLMWEATWRSNRFPVDHH